MNTASPPQAVAPAGPRYFVVQEQKCVEWMSSRLLHQFQPRCWNETTRYLLQGRAHSVRMGTGRDTGTHAGDDPIQSCTAYLASYCRFRPHAFEMVQPVCAVHFESEVPDLVAKKGEVAIRKFPRGECAVILVLIEKLLTDRLYRSEGHVL